MDGIVVCQKEKENNTLGRARIACEYRWIRRVLFVESSLNHATSYLEIH